ncbi:MAG TPA: hypothetical protein VFD84_13915 [Candidatus Binatia bacterium]|nr:hypothetical protein [Candidatus Binatia bacterium]
MDSSLLQTPETLSFYPPVSLLQFDTGTAGFDCMGDMVLFIEGVAPGGASLGTTSWVLPVAGETITLDFPPPGAEKVVSSHTCGPEGSLFHGVEVFTVDNIALVPAPQPASACASLELRAAAKKVKAKTRCYSRAVLAGKPVDPKCLATAEKSFARVFALALTHGDCLTTEDAATVESAVDAFVAGVNEAVNGGAPGPDVCDSRKIAAAGRNAVDVGHCYTKPTRRSTAVDPACILNTSNALSRALRNCGSEADVAALLALSEDFARKITRQLTVPSTTTTTTTTTSTTTTTAPPLGQHLTFTTALGTANCGGAGLSSPPDAPLSGEIDADTAGTMPISGLGLGCLYIGGGNSGLAASQVPENASSILDTADGVNLTASFGTGPGDCSRGPAATRHCVNDPSITCTSDVECAGAPGGCAFDANCFFGPPVPVNGFPSSCVVNHVRERRERSPRPRNRGVHRQHPAGVARLPDARPADRVPAVRERDLLVRGERGRGVHDEQQRALEPRLPAEPRFVRRDAAREPESAHDRIEHRHRRRRALLSVAEPRGRVRSGDDAGDHRDGLARR